MQCCGVCLSVHTIVYEHDGVDKIRVDSMWQHVHMQTCKADVLHVCMLAAMFDDRTYKESNRAS